MGLTSEDIVKASDKIRKVGSVEPTTVWRKPIELFAKTEKDCLKHSYKKFCKIPDKDWRVKSQVVSEILQLFRTYIVDKMERAPEKYGEIILHDFAPQGSSREGLKVKSLDEFDVLMPFSFRTHKIEFVTTSENRTIPSRHAEVRIKNPSEWFAKYKLLNSFGFLLSRSVHERFLRGLIEEAASAIVNTVEVGKRREICFAIRVTTNPPAITLHIKFTNNYLEGSEEIDVDLVPGIMMGSTPPGAANSCSRYALARWFHESQNPIFTLPKEHLDILWKISYSEFEIRIFDSIRTSPIEQYIITAARIVKGLRGSIIKSDQYQSVYKSYYLKNILLYTLLYFTKIHKTQISGVTEAFTCFVEMCRITLRHKKLPYFFVSSSNLQKMLPGRSIPGLSHGLDLYEGIQVSIPSILKSFDEALKKADIEDQKEVLARHKTIFMEFEKHVS